MFVFVLVRKLLSFVKPFACVNCYNQLYDILKNVLWFLFGQRTYEKFDYSEEEIARGDEYIDKLLKDMFENRVEEYDPYNIEDSSIGFHRKVLLVNVSGEAKLFDGYINGLKTLHRPDHCALEDKNGRLHVKANLGAGELKFHYSGTVKFMNLGPTITIHGTLDYLEVSMEFDVDAETGKDGKLTKFVIDDMRGMKVWVTGLGPMNWAVNPIVKGVTLVFKRFVRNFIESKAHNHIAKRIPDFQFPVEGVDITTTTEEPVVTETEEPVVTETEEPVVTETEEPVVTETEEPVVTETEEPVVTETEEPEVTETEEPEVPQTEEPEVPQTEEPEVPETEEPEVPETEEPEVPETEEPVVPETEEPVVPETEEPVVPETEEPVVPETEEPVVPETEEPVVPETEEPVVPETEEPVVPETEEPVVEEPEEPEEIVEPAENAEPEELEDDWFDYSSDEDLFVRKNSRKRRHS